jgi:hypothetical protein
VCETVYGLVELGSSRRKAPDTETKSNRNLCASASVLEARLMVVRFPVSAATHLSSFGPSPTVGKEIARNLVRRT